MTKPPSLQDSFKQAIDGSDMMATTLRAENQEQHALFLGMGDAADLQSAGLMAKNNASDKLAIEMERKKRNKDAVDRALLDSVNKRLDDIEAEMSDLERKIADSRNIIDANRDDIAFIRSLDTVSLYNADGSLRTDVDNFLGEHSYTHLEDKSESDIRHILTTIEVRAIEENENEESKIHGWTERHDHLRNEAKDITNDISTPEIEERLNSITARDPEILARQRMEAMENGQTEIAQEAQTQVATSKFAIESSSFSM